MTTFAEIVDAADSLTVDEQRTLLDILRLRIAEKNRKAIAQDVLDARAEFQMGNVIPANAGDILREARSES